MKNRVRTKFVLLAALFVLAAVLLVLHLPRHIRIDPVSVTEENRNASGRTAVISADLAVERPLFGSPRLTGTVTVDGVTYESSDRYDKKNRVGGYAGVFFLHPELVTDFIATLAAGNVEAELEGDVLAVMEVHAEEGTVSYFRVPLDGGSGG